MDPDWVLATLNDVMDALDEAIGEIASNPEEMADLLAEVMPAIYAKLNYAWNSRELGPQAIDVLDHDDLIAFPKDLSLG